jgi:hypothetical protein
MGFVAPAGERSYKINTGPIKEVARQILTKNDYFNLKNEINFNAAITEIYPRIPGNCSRNPWDPRSTLWESVI